MMTAEGEEQHIIFIRQKSGERNAFFGIEV